MSVCLSKILSTISDSFSRNIETFDQRNSDTTIFLLPFTTEKKLIPLKPRNQIWAWCKRQITEGSNIWFLKTDLQHISKGVKMEFGIIFRL